MVPCWPAAATSIDSLSLRPARTLRATLPLRRCDSSPRRSSAPTQTSSGPRTSADRAPSSAGSASRSRDGDRCVRTSGRRALPTGRREWSLMCKRRCARSCAARHGSARRMSSTEVLPARTRMSWIRGNPGSVRPRLRRSQAWRGSRRRPTRNSPRMGAHLRARSTGSARPKTDAPSRSRSTLAQVPRHGCLEARAAVGTPPRTGAPLAPRSPGSAALDRSKECDRRRRAAHLASYAHRT